jgi:hypothetical protein
MAQQAGRYSFLMFSIARFAPTRILRRLNKETSSQAALAKEAESASQWNRNDNLARNGNRRWEWRLVQQQIMNRR